MRFATGAVRSIGSWLWRTSHDERPNWTYARAYAYLITIGQGRSDIKRVFGGLSEVLAVSGAVLAIAACGGGGSDERAETASTDSAPPSATSGTETSATPEERAVAAAQDVFRAYYQREGDDDPRY